MKKFLKLLSITGAILLVTGALVMCIAAFIYKWNSSTAGDPDLGDQVYEYADAEFTEVKINASYGNIEIKEGSTWSVSLDNVYLPKASVIRNNDKLSITLNSSSDIKLLGWAFGVLVDYDLKENAKITVTYPTGTDLDILHCDAGFGTISAEGVNARLLFCQSPVGKVKLNNCNISERVAFDTVFGLFETKNVMTGKLDLDMRAGIADIDMSKISANTINYNSNFIFSR